ncbi:hypothetical protein PHYSODRAFT_288495 [Phytophthora sojae]|uniref:RxLR effector protein n=3 Tax=Phytophthora sojae TaxID=67593 RepID=G5A533_PHYSP|nr:hypothetical protein PHYSODRAFT_288495 [Phytophthora sojae]AEK80600.1 Avh68 [Phytophthora sojae]AEK80601.1 Avh68 [Phytophthora sojae]EGZ09782.1 hypothetical protein PHYSODRAFT_288495 [Phytophthora sojae]|eukprot:XP_009534643.1 hypothetical protein PHYSODRAFT_288495 [Phytophthora sojae]
MRLFHAIVVVVAVLVAGNDASRDPADISKTTLTSPLLDSPGEVKGSMSKRFLRTGETASSHVEMAERRLVNIDHILQDAAIAAKWKVQFITWKKIGKTPAKLLEELGISGNAHP